MAKKGGSKQKKMNARVDFTPMVDMIMLLVTFFMLCTTLLKPQTMEITMPADKDEANKENNSQVDKGNVVTIFVANDNKIFYCEGEQIDANMKETAYGKDGIRAILLKKNLGAAKKVEELKKKYASLYSSNVAKAEENKENYNKELQEIKDGKENPVVIIKPSDGATYLNLIDVLDEMQNCYIGKYFIDKVNQNDADMVGKLGGKIDVPEDKAAAPAAAAE